MSVLSLLPPPHPPPPSVRFSGDDNIAIVGNSHDITIRNIVGTAGHGIR